MTIKELFFQNVDFFNKTKIHFISNVVSLIKETNVLPADVTTVMQHNAYQTAKFEVLLKNKYDDETLTLIKNCCVLYDYVVSTLDNEISVDVILLWYSMLNKEYSSNDENLHLILEKFVANLKKVVTFNIKEISRFHVLFQYLNPFNTYTYIINIFINLKLCINNNLQPFVILKEIADEYDNIIKMCFKTNTFNFLEEFLVRMQRHFKSRTFPTTSVVNKYENKINEWFKKHEHLRRSDIEKIFKVTPSGAKKILLKLLGFSQIKRVGAGNNVVYQKVVK